MAGYPLRNTSRKTEAGYSLIEALVAFAILSFAVAAAFAIYANTLRITMDTKARAMARLHLESLLAEVGRTKPLTEGVQTGAYEHGYAWRVTIVPYEEASAGANPSFDAFEVTASVAWGGDRALSLTTLRLAPKADR